MTAAIRTPHRPDDAPSKAVALAEIPAAKGHPYVIERRIGHNVLRLARVQANGKTVSFMLGAADARNLAAALCDAADELENK